MPRVFFYVQHLLGIGHVVRALRIARGLRESGFEVDFVMGGVPIPNNDLQRLNVVQLPPVRAANASFDALVGQYGELVDEAFKKARVDALLESLLQSRPDIILIETFPFGRQQMRFELMPLLEAAHAKSRRPPIVSSVRDILQESKKPDRARETIDLLHIYFDHVIVHGDPRFITLDATFPLASEIAHLLSYSGLIAPQAPIRSPSTSSLADVVVSVGGGSVGHRLLKTAISAKSLSSLAGARWLIVTGPNIDPHSYCELRTEAGEHGIALVQFLPDLAAVLAGAVLSISQAGYNTVADILVAGCKAVFVPFAGGGETEQSLRARLLEANGIGISVPDDMLSTDNLLSAIDRSLALPRQKIDIDLGGVAGTARILERLLSRGG